MAKRQGRYTLILDEKPSIESFSSVAGKKEREGPLGRLFDITTDDTTFKKDSWEKAESQMLKECITKTLEKGQLSSEQIDYILAGDLLNQCVTSSYANREINIPFIGLFGACSTMALSIGLAGLMVDAGLAGRCIAATSSHFCSAERQFRLPLEYGGQRTPTAQWTVTGSGSVVVSNARRSPHISAVTIGRIVDLGVKDACNMGQAMAPAAAETIKDYLTDTGESPDSFDAIVTGDLGLIGSELMLELLMKYNINIAKQHKDCGIMIFDIDKQDVHAGGSGCGCSASVLCAYFLPKLASGEYKRILFAGTGALMSPTIVQQGESIPGICHLTEITSQ